MALLSAAPSVVPGDRALVDLVATDPEARTELRHKAARAAIPLQAAADAILAVVMATGFVAGAATASHARRSGPECLFS